MYDEYFIGSSIFEAYSLWVLNFSPAFYGQEGVNLDYSGRKYLLSHKWHRQTRKSKGPRKFNIE